MAITQSDIKLVRSQVMADTSSGGGAPTPTVIADAVSNALFPDISELDRAAGRVNLRKVFLHVQTSTLDQFFGANIIVAEPPSDPNVHISIFSTKQTFDRRTDAQNRVESYLNIGPKWDGFLYENHISGQRTIQIFQRTTAAPPAVGRTLVLVWHLGQADERRQYVRVTRVDSVERTFTTPELADYKANIVTCDLSDALRYDFPGTAANRTFTPGATATELRDTVVADAASYYSAVPLEEPVALGDAVAKATTIYTQLVPSARTEMSIIDARPANNVEVVLATSPRQVTVSSSPNSQRIKVGQENRGFNYVSILTPKPAPGTVRVQYRVGGQSYFMADDGAGALTGSGTGTVNYNTGSIAITLEALPDDRSNVLIFWGQALTYTNRSAELNFRPPEWSFSLDHVGIVPGTLSVEWTSGGVVKTATASAAGVFSGDGTGTVNHVSGLVFLKPNSMIDPGGELLIDYQWGVVQEDLLVGLAPDGTGSVTLTFSQVPVPGSVSAEWVTTRASTTSSGATSSSGSTAKSNASSSSTTFVDTTKTFIGRADEDLSAYNEPGTTVTGTPLSKVSVTGALATWQGVQYTATTKVPCNVTKEVNATNGSSYMTASQQTAKVVVTVSHVVTDDAAGHWFGSFGALNYASKSGTLKVLGDWSETSYESNHEESTNWESLNGTSDAGIQSSGLGAPATTASGGGGAATAKGGSTGSASVAEAFGSAGVLLRYRTGAGSPQSHTMNWQPKGVTLDLLPRSKDQVVPGSVLFTWMGTQYRDVDGMVYRGWTNSSPGVASGVMNYTAGVAHMLDYVVSGSASALSVQSLWTTSLRTHMAEILLATQVSPIKPTGFVMTAVGVEGTQVVGTSALDGMIVGPHMRGRIDYESGAAEVQFGDYVVAASLTAADKAEWWYSDEGVRTDGKIWRPWPIDPNTVRYNAAAYKYLPLDAEIIGLDPVRLPSDGRVPFLRSGSFAVLGHKAETAPVTATNGMVVDCGRQRLSRVRVLDANDAVVTTGYAANLELGTVTYSDVTGYAQPVRVEHRVEDMVMVSDAQINGRLAFTRQVSHAYPVPGSYVSSALVVGDMQTYVSTLFDQVSFDGTWSDSPGPSATGTFNDVLAPIGLTNNGAVTERWVVQFTSTTAFRVIGEHVGVIAVGNTAEDCAPVNPATGHPYFTIPALGWGSGWSNGNALRFNTIGTLFPVWVVRTIQQGPETVEQDKFTLLMRGDVDHP